MDDKLINIPNDDKQNQPSVDCFDQWNNWLKSFDTTSLELIYQNSIKVTKVFKPTNKITCFIKLWISVSFSIQCSLSFQLYETIRFCATLFVLVTLLEHLFSLVNTIP